MTSASNTLPTHTNSTKTTQPNPPSSPAMTRPTRNVRVTAPHPSSPSNTFQPTPLPSTHPKTRDIPQGKNLRWTAVALVQKLSLERERPSAAVADEIALAACDELRALHPHRDMAAVERNTRRRVYDALKVMVSAGCIQREGKALRWIGIDDLRQPSRNLSQSRHSEIRVAICEARRRIARKMTIASDFRTKTSAFERFYTMRETKPTPHPTSPTSTLRFPFVLVKTTGSATVAYSPDKSTACLTPTANFKLYSETDIVCLIAERRRHRPIAKRPRIPRKIRNQHSHKVQPQLPPPPPPSPRDPSLQSASSTTARGICGMQPQAIVDLALHSFSKPTQHTQTAKLAEEGQDVHRGCNLNILDSAKADRCLDSEIPVQFANHDDDEDFFTHLRHTSQVLAEELDPSANGCSPDSSAADEVGREFERIVRYERAKQDFDQDVPMLCDEDMDDSHIESDPREDKEEVLEGRGEAEGDGSAQPATAIKHGK